MRDQNSAEAQSILAAREHAAAGEYTSSASTGPDDGVVTTAPEAAGVITQVTTREPVVRPRGFQPLDPPSTSSSGTWKNKFRCLLCCFAPSANESYRPYGPATAAATSLPRQLQPAYKGPALISEPLECDRGRKCLVLDLDETLVHSSFKPVPDPDYIIPVEIDGRMVDVYVLKRPFMDHFMSVVGELFEVVVFTASLSKYADPLLDLMDKEKNIRWRLFREACCTYEGTYVKDLSCIGRPLSDTIIVDNSPHSYVFQPENAIPIGAFIDDKSDRELLDLIPVLEAVRSVDDVREHLTREVTRMLDRQAQARKQGLRNGFCHQ